MNSAGEWETGDTLDEALLNSSVHVETGAVAASGFSMVSFDAYAHGPVVVWNAYVKRTGSTISAGADGNFTDTHVFTMPPALQGANDQLQGCYGVARSMVGFLTAHTGVVRVSATTANGQWPNNSTFILAGTFMRN